VQMKSLDYFHQAESVLLGIGLDLDDLGEYDDRTQRWLEAATNLKNPRTKTFYTSNEIEMIVVARMYFKQFRKLSAFYNEGITRERNRGLDEKHLEQERKLAALGFSMREIEKIMHIDRGTIRRHGYSEWQKVGKIRDEK
jgi:hypothetical protein